MLAAAFTVLAGLLVAWALDRAADRVQVVGVARAVPAGTVITADDLTVTAIAFDTAVTGLVPARSLDALVGRVATIDLAPGALLTVGMWADGSELAADERTVGAVLEPGTHPAGLAAGSAALAVPLRPGDAPGAGTGDGAGAGTGDGTGAGTGDGTGDSTGDGTGDGMSTTPVDGVVVRVLDADGDDSGGRRVTLAVPAEHAADLARLAAMESLVLVGVPTQLQEGQLPEDGS